MTGTTNRRPMLIAGLAALAILSSACDGAVSGNPSPTTPAPTVTTGTSSSNGDPFAKMTPCATLDQTLMGQGYAKAVPTTADTERSCTSNKVGDSDVALSLQAGQTIDENIPDRSKAFPGKLNGRALILEREPTGITGQCSIGLEVQPGSRALLAVGTSAKTTDQACDMAETFAKKLEPLLPKAG
ncbi:DUF3558 family protein [Amycolatopsis rhabdoformis]|uniref:DUF3558 family protein n=1 Tax=Amycolatopsis rhabdoformis TaxID=1448059 RepID=A0ABZ1HZC1_9PSEU|nr:DUF3558 family protein [Amycolatopsis rhabdoformis]WSE27532.1 DUF3558 family protein [Amycolatopsis rhabdoformis]